MSAISSPINDINSVRDLNRIGASNLNKTSKEFLSQFNKPLVHENSISNIRVRDY